MTEMKILTYLIENNDKIYTINEISKNLEISYKVTYEIIKRLETENLINLKKVGNSNQISFNFNFNKKVLEVETRRRLKVIERSKDIKRVFNDINSLNYSFLIVLLFGSYVNNKQNKNSDIDICIICDNNEIVKKITSKFSILPLDIHLQTFSFEEYKSMLNVKNVDISSEITKKNIILFGIESYYDLIKNG